MTPFLQIISERILFVVVTAVVLGRLFFRSGAGVGEDDVSLMHDVKSPGDLFVVFAFAGFFQAVDRFQKLGLFTVEILAAGIGTLIVTIAFVVGDAFGSVHQHGQSLA